MTYFCPECWQEVQPDDRTCRHCGADMSEAARRTFPEKLVAALNHWEPSTPIRAAGILSRIRHAQAIPALLARAAREIDRARPDPYLVAACLRAAEELGADREVLEELLRRTDSRVVRRLLSKDERNASD